MCFITKNQLSPKPPGALPAARAGLFFLGEATLACWAPQEHVYVTTVAVTVGRIKLSVPNPTSQPFLLHVLQLCDHSLGRCEEAFTAGDRV